jgi:hypothetical protein
VDIINIDKEPPVITILPYTTTPTNQDITVSATVEGGTLAVSSHTFTANGSFTFTASDAAGNTSQVTVDIINIDEPPVITILPYTTTPTNQDITVSATVEGGTLAVSSHTFTANGSFTFTASDAAGNTSQVTVDIINIDKEPPVITILPYTTTPTNKDIIGNRNGGRRDAGRQQPHLYGERQFYLHRQRCGRQYESSHGGHH